MRGIFAKSQAKQKEKDEGKVQMMMMTTWRIQDTDSGRALSFTAPALEEHRSRILAADD